MKNIQFFDYQRNAIDKTSPMPFFALFFKPGRGKTVTTLAIAEQKFKLGQFKILVITTTKKIIGFGGWQKQIEKYTDFFQPFVWDGSKVKTAKYWKELETYLVTASPFPILMINLEAFQIWNKELMKFLEGIEKDTFWVVDESTKIKNISKSKKKPGRTRNLISVTRNAQVRAILSGTPRPHSIVDLWAQFEFLRSRFWKEVSLYVFEATYQYKIKRHNWNSDVDYDYVVTDYDLEILKAKMQEIEKVSGKTEKQEEYLAKLRFEYDDIKQHLDQVRRREADVYSQIEPYTFYAPRPSRIEPIEEELLVDLTKEEALAYKEMKNELMTLAANGELVSITQKSALFHKFRQITGGSLDREHGISGTPSKLSMLLEDVSEHEEKVIICSSYVRNIKMIAEALRNEGVVEFWGETSQEDVGTALERFSSVGHRFFVCNPTVASHGLDGIQHICRQMIFYDLPIAPADALEQVRARIDREGQEEQCVFKWITARGTVDERVLGLISDREDGQKRFEKMSLAQFKEMF